MISGSWDRAPCGALCSEGSLFGIFSLSAPPPACATWSLSLSLSQKKGVVLIIYRIPILQQQKDKQPNEKMGKGHFSKDLQMTNNTHVERCPTSLVIMEMQTETTRYTTLHPLRWLISQKYW